MKANKKTPPNTLARRKFLRSAGLLSAAGFGLPLLEAALTGNGDAYADGSELPVRFGSFFWGNGVHPETWTPPTTGPDWTVPADWGLGPIITRGLKSQISVVSGTGIPGTVFPHVWPLPIIFSGQRRGILDVGTERFIIFETASVDQVLARELGKAPPMVVAVNRRPSDNATLIEPHLSWTGYNEPVVPEMNPAALFQQIFGNIGASPDEGLARKSVIDAIAGQLGSLKGTLGKTDSQRMDSHLTALRQLEASLDFDTSGCGDEPAGLAGHDPNDNSAAGIRARNQAFIDVMALALSCNARTTFSLMFTAGGDQTPLPAQENYPNHGTHSLNHVGFGGTDAERAEAQEDVKRTVNYEIDHFADLVETFANVSEVTGESLLDSCGILATTDCWWGNDHGCDPFPMIVAGGVRGELNMGTHIQATGNPLPNAVTLSVLRAIRQCAGGPETPEFGSGAELITEGISELEA